jgi:hypothetical protein
VVVFFRRTLVTIVGREFGTIGTHEHHNSIAMIVEDGDAPRIGTKYLFYAAIGTRVVY